MRIGSITATLAAVTLLLTVHAPAAQAQVPFFVYGSGLKFEVTPENAEIFLDGYYVGTADDFDGVFQRLRPRASRHAGGTHRHWSAGLQRRHAAAGAHQS